MIEFYCEKTQGYFSQFIISDWVICLILDIRYERIGIQIYRHTIHFLQTLHTDTCPPVVVSTTIMITGKDIYDVLAAIVPLYVAMILAYGSVRWWKIFTPDQCSGINRFVAVYAVPLLSFHFISTNDPYKMNYQFIAADCLQKIVILVALFIWHNLTNRSNLDWTITLFSLSTLPNTLVMGIPLLSAMYGEYSGNLMVQIVVLQCVIWYTLMLFLFEYRGAKALINDQFPEVGGSITSMKVDSDVMSLNGREPLQADAEVGDDGKLHVVVRKSTTTSVRSMGSSSYNNNNNNKGFGLGLTPRASNLTGVEIYSVQSSREPTPRGSSFNKSDFYAMFTSKMTSPKTTNNATPTTAVASSKAVHGGLGEEVGVRFAGKSSEGESCSYPGPNPKVMGGDNKEVQMYVWSSNTSPEANPRHQQLNTPSSGDFDSSNLVFQPDLSSSKGNNKC